MEMTRSKILFIGSVSVVIAVGSFFLMDLVKNERGLYESESRFSLEPLGGADVALPSVPDGVVDFRLVELSSVEDLRQFIGSRKVDLYKFFAPQSPARSAFWGTGSETLYNNLIVIQEGGEVGCLYVLLFNESDRLIGIYEFPQNDQSEE